MPGREYVKEFLEDVKILQVTSCQLKGKWTQSQINFTGNAQAHTLARKNTNEQICAWGKITVNWLRAQPHYRIIEHWQAMSHVEHKPARRPFPATTGLPGRSAIAIFRLRSSFTIAYILPIQV